jgi:hypothetical protein
MLDFVAFTKATPQQDLVFVSSASGGHMHGPVSFWHKPNY